MLQSVPGLVTLYTKETEMQFFVSAPNIRGPNFIRKVSIKIIYAIELASNVAYSYSYFIKLLCDTENVERINIKDT
jgi:hypothetical protein